MISIELDSYRIADCAGPLTPEAVQALGCLLDRCDEEKIQDISLRLPVVPSQHLEPMLRPVLARPFRFSAWLRALPSASLADLLISTGHRITIATTLSADGRELRSLVQCPAYAAGAPWQMNLFLALPAPPLNLAAMLDGLELRRGTSLTLGLAWNGPETGPSLIPAPLEPDWAEVLLGIAALGTQRGVMVHLACGLPLCLFSTEQLGELALMKVRFPLAGCAPGLVITLDGRAQACPRLPTGGWVLLPAGVALRKLATQLISPWRFLTGFCGRPGEQSCRSRSAGACGGGCLANNTAGWCSAGGFMACGPQSAGRMP